MFQISARMAISSWKLVNQVYKDILWTTASASPECKLEPQELSPHPDSQNQNLHVNKIPGHSLHWAALGSLENAGFDGGVA